MTHMRPAAVAGAFYPGDAATLTRTVDDLMAEARAATPAETPVPKAIIAPHAGYMFSGPTAALAYARLAPLKGRVKRVVLLGPAHRVPFRGLALPTVDSFETPLGPVALDTDAINDVAEHVPGAGFSDKAHQQEHSLEVHLPFLRAILGPEPEVVPVCVGDAKADEVAALLDHLWGGEETLIVISTDLSHFLDYDTARRVDAGTVAAVEHLDPSRLTHENACGLTPMAGLLLSAKKRRMSIETLDARSSGDTAGPRDRVVGYAAWALYEPQAHRPEAADPEASVEDMLRDHGATLTGVARESIRHALSHGQPLTVDVMAHAAPLRANGACFVTLTTGSGHLRGCIGSPQAWRPLVQDVAENAYRAAFHDPRFPPLMAGELADLGLSLSVLTPAMPFPVDSEEDLIARVRPGVDGLILGDRGQRGLFLPAVWESLPDPRDFVRHLKQKAGLPAHHWSPTLTVERFTAKSVKG
ncbi:Putative dioxygenase [Caenispirillum salinarum AK4]|uniref:MEMO1 family protein C882_4443 n=1 Tax=Caenispirillum salinarum AK4 TaxID=1238182 RepID=K9H0A3_9PROT|nr:AmmeMemoRadiSam system protein B [Caenispirillum salinarum]EKV30484.1 Putative dioxygenase [Caenispirillum salinarum AK4]